MKKLLIILGLVLIPVWSMGQYSNISVGKIVNIKQCYTPETINFDKECMADTTLLVFSGSTDKIVTEWKMVASPIIEDTTWTDNSTFFISSISLARLLCPT